MTKPRIRECNSQGCTRTALRNGQACEYHLTHCYAPLCDSLRYTEPGGRRKSYCMQHLNWLKKTGSVLGYEPRERAWGDGFIDPSGYVRLRIKGKHKFEHRDVIERQIGRPLRRDETVHHVNGVRHDNRLENLELWTTSQPYGQRVEDKLTWAREILARYAA